MAIRIDLIWRTLYEKLIPIIDYATFEREKFESMRNDKGINEALESIYEGKIVKNGPFKGMKSTAFAVMGNCVVSISPRANGFGNQLSRLAAGAGGTRFSSSTKDASSFTTSRVNSSSPS